MSAIPNLMTSSHTVASFFRKLVSVIFFVSLWEFLSYIKLNQFLLFINIPSPFQVLARLVQELSSFAIYEDMGHTLLRVFLGVIIASFVGVSLGIASGLNTHFDDFLFPISELLRPIPNIAWAPLVVVLFPVVEHSIIFITFIGAFFPILINTKFGVRSIPKKYFNTAKTLGFTFYDRLFQLVFPAALPMILTGIRIGMGVSWLGVIVAEMISGRNGIGYYTWLGYQLVDFTQIITGIVCIGVLSLGSSLLVTLIESLVLKWQRI